MSKQSERRTLILDTSVFVHNPHCTQAFPNDNVVVSAWVINQLDDLKRSAGDLGEHARQALRMIHEYSAHKGFPDGVNLENGGKMRVYSSHAIPVDIGSSAHEKTILLAKRLESKCPEGTVAIVSKDPTLRIKARMQGLRAVDYEGEGNLHDPYSLFPGCFEIVLDRPDPRDELYRNSWVDRVKVISATSSTIDHLTANQCVYFTFEGKETLAIYKKSEQGFRLVPKPKTNGNSDRSAKGVQPRNCEQAFAYALLTDPGIEAVALVGSAGPGKTLMSLLAGYRQLRNEFETGAKSPASSRSIPCNCYSRIMVFRPTVEMGEKLGFLPGTLDEKIEPWMYPVFDNMDLILEHVGADSKSKQYDPVVDLINRNILQILPINYIRGRSIHDTFMIVDEAQNFSGDKLRSLLTRAGRGTKVVLTGDITQIDDPYMDKYSNGLSHVISRFMGQEIFGYTIMERGEERSLLAKLSAALL